MRIVGRAAVVLSRLLEILLSLLVLAGTTGSMVHSRRSSRSSCWFCRNFCLCRRRQEEGGFGFFDIINDRVMLMYMMMTIHNGGFVFCHYRQDHPGCDLISPTSNSKPYDNKYGTIDTKSNLIQYQKAQ